MKKNVCLSRLLLSRLLLSRLLPLLAVLVMASCTRHSEAWPQLLEAETLLETDLPTAGAMIDSVDASLLHGEDAALYAILKTQADYKRYLPLTSDSLPRLATDYYGTPYRKNYRAAMAWYSLGCTYLDQRDDLKAIDALLKAKPFILIHCQDIMRCASNNWANSTYCTIFIPNHWRNSFLTKELLPRLQTVP